ncbi:MAG: ABC transporter permease [Roseiarcus sp.]
MSDQQISKARRGGGGLNILLGLTLLVLLMAMWVALSIETTTFWSSINIANLLRQGAMIAILAIGETFVIITGGIDLSVGAVAGFTSMFIALLLTNVGWLGAHGFGFFATIPGAVIATLLIGVFIGLFHAFGVVQMGLPPFIMTLATMYSLRGIGLLITNGATISIDNDAFTGFSRASFLGFPWTDGSWFEIPMLFWMVILVAVPAYILLNQSRWGRYLFAIGSNSEAARLSGVNVKAITYLAYIISGTCAAFVGVLLAMRIGIGNPTQAEGWELQAIASSVIGGTSLFGALGSVHGPLIGSFILTTINNGANLLNLNPFWQRIITGALIIIVVYFDTLRRKKR